MRWIYISIIYYVDYLQISMSVMEGVDVINCVSIPMVLTIVVVMMDIV